MDHLPNEDVEIPMPLNTTYPTPHLHPHGHGHGQLFDHDDDDDHGFDQNQGGLTSKKQQVRYKECLKNHAASMGGNARDGCGEFMPSGEEGTIEALTCSACNCHRNFHRKEVEGERGRMVISHKGNEAFGPYGPRAFPIVPYNMSPLRARPDQSYDVPPPPLLPPHHQYHHHHHHSHHHNQGLKKRFRTKFTQEQKEKMMSFAEKVGWKIQKQEESVVQQFCQEIGVKRRVLKVWMHNNKHNLTKKMSSTPPING